MGHSNSRTLVVLTGPVGVGKSTSAHAVARHLRSAGVPVACLDLDQLYCMTRQREGFDDQDTWRIARHSAAVLTEHFFEQFANVVIVEGGFFNKTEQHQLVDALQSRPRLVFVTLHASFDTVQGRVMDDADPGRIASKVPAFLRHLYAEYEAALPFLRDASTGIQADDADAEQVGRQIAALVTSARGN
ncbi:adenylyl-sulfate kinase [Rhodoferax sp. AJA081-3]|uniref:adenylyl-sulfate kinase n=1 Tax=Rhodoferax sp. AJA081-3 TaxID=2752316 RepID=UPI001ADF9EB5|nr:adenylyl-sulfate kinase [Rhodoferax sp. AJA081-3]QTN27361.1 adenylyl-sulfate kinase [Rhodoferax sp. AJA081-3]